MQEFYSNLHFTSIWWSLFFPILLIVLDIMTGIIKAWKNNNFQSSVMRAGLSKKFGEIVYILIGILTKFALGTDLLLYFLIGYISLMEISSLFENCDELGVKIPEKIKEKLNNGGDKND